MKHLTTFLQEQVNLILEIKQSDYFFNKDSVQSLLDTFYVGCEFEMFVNNIRKSLKPYVKDKEAFDWCLNRTHLDLSSTDPYISDLFRAIGLLLNDTIDANDSVLYLPEYIPFSEKEKSYLYDVNTNEKVNDSTFSYWHVTSDISVKSKNILAKFPIELKSPVFPINQFFGEPNDDSYNGIFGRLMTEFVKAYGSTDSTTGLHVNISSNKIVFSEKVHWPLVFKMMTVLNTDNESDISSDFEYRAEPLGSKGKSGYSVHNLKHALTKQFIVTSLKDNTHFGANEINHYIQSIDEKYSMINFTKMEANVIELRVLGGSGYELKADLIKQYVYKLIQAIILSSEDALIHVWGITKAEREIAKIEKSSLKSLHSYYAKDISRTQIIKKASLINNIKSTIELISNTTLPYISSIILDARYKSTMFQVFTVFNNDNKENYALRKTELQLDLRKLILQTLDKFNLRHITIVDTQQVKHTEFYAQLKAIPKLKLTEVQIEDFVLLMFYFKKLASNTRI